MSYELLNKHSIKFHHNSIDFPELILKIGDKSEIHPGQTDIFLLLKKYKDQIENIKNPKIWDFYKKLTNEFEMINLNNKSKYQTVNTGVANYEPISRSYFKLWEIIVDFNLIDFNRTKLSILGLAEGPGGFIECIYNMRKIYTKNEYRDSCVCITLRSYNNEIPGWKKSARLFRENPSISTYYGEDNTGDLYRCLNIRGIVKECGKKSVDIVTADGGFDFSVDYNKQEQSAYHLILCEITAAFSTLNIDGTFILKIFDTFTTFTIKIIYFLTTRFKEVRLTKPFTSRPANSEKYLVCTGFIGIEDEDLENLYAVLDDWYILKSQSKQVIDLFNFNVPDEFSDIIKAYNIHVGMKQIKNILKTLTYIRLKLNNNNINEIKQKQALISSFWCKKYKIPINFKCKFFKDTVDYYNYIPNFIN